MESLFASHHGQNCCSEACQYGSQYDASLCSILCNSSDLEYISTGRLFGIEAGENGTRLCGMGVWELDTESCSAIEGISMDESAVHIPRDVHEEGEGGREGGIVSFCSLSPQQILMCCVSYSGLTASLHNFSKTPFSSPPPLPPPPPPLPYSPRSTLGVPRGC